jgi:hypothetical protein
MAGARAARIAEQGVDRLQSADRSPLTFGSDHWPCPPVEVRLAMTRWLVAAVIAMVAAAAWIIGAKFREAGEELATASLWPRPDGSERSFGLVWDFPDAAA